MDNFFVTVDPRYSPGAKMNEKLILNAVPSCGRDFVVLYDILCRRVQCAKVLNSTVHTTLDRPC